MGIVSSPIRNAVRRVGHGLVVEPFAYRTGIHLDFANSLHYVKASGGGAVTRGALTSLFTFTGGNQSYYMGPDGLLVPSVTNTPRVEYSAVGQPYGLLMEAARTNLALHSNDGTNAAWVKVNATAAKTATGPDGVASSATTLTATAGNGTALQTVVSVSATRTLSVWLKRRTGSGNVDIAVDGVTYTTQAITSSWARYTLTQAAVTNPVFGIRLVTSGDEVDFWCAQMESAAFASSSIPTTTASVARTADSCIRTLSSEFSATAGTVVVRGRASGGQDSGAAQIVWDIGDTTANNRLFVARQTAADTLRYQIFTGGVGQGPLDNTFINSTPFKAATAWAANDLALSFNGAAIQTDASASIPTVTSLGLGIYTGVSSQMNGHILTFDYYPERKPNGFLVSAST